MSNWSDMINETKVTVDNTAQKVEEEPKFDFYKEKYGESDYVLMFWNPNQKLEQWMVKDLLEGIDVKARGIRVGKSGKCYADFENEDILEKVKELDGEKVGDVIITVSNVPKRSDAPKSTFNKTLPTKMPEKKKPNNTSYRDKKESLEQGNNNQERQQNQYQRGKYNNYNQQKRNNYGNTQDKYKYNNNRNQNQPQEVKEVIEIKEVKEVKNLNEIVEIKEIKEEKQTIELTDENEYNNNNKQGYKQKGYHKQYQNQDHQQRAFSEQQRGRSGNNYNNRGSYRGRGGYNNHNNYNNNHYNNNQNQQKDQKDIKEVKEKKEIIELNSSNAIVEKKEIKEVKEQKTVPEDQKEASFTNKTRQYGENRGRGRSYKTRGHNTFNPGASKKWNDDDIPTFSGHTTEQYTKKEENENIIIEKKEIDENQSDDENGWQEMKSKGPKDKKKKTKKGNK